MAGGFDPIDPEKCAHYAGFASHLDRKSFDFLYWVLFVLVIFMLFLASWKYSGDLEKIRVLGLEPDSRQYKNKMKKCMLICSIYATVSIVGVIMEVYALMALQFCDGEDLMPLYWSTWTMMQVGSVIAILGILLAIFNSLRGSKNPPWALALGTPILVVAGIGHAVHGAVHKRVKRVRSMSRGRRRGVSTSDSTRLETGAGLPMSREITLRADESEREDVEIPARFVGLTADGAPIIRFTEDPGKIEPEHGVVLGRPDGHVIIAFKKAMKVIRDSDDSDGTNGSGSSSSSGSGGNGNGYGYGGRGRSNGNGNSNSNGEVTPTPRSPVVRIASPPRMSPKWEDSAV
ncbi:hypothetical protein F5144DRAFT_597522 [Chaetomium tenue]|uniref:Uncharacterized protein n=1 Tax=Chaetomium tenue TaxID=1854479 RepID=A0ACB7PMM7_9PEZI|nr:hypothetical protein F5144DRAFT_597522 [Chaetomium globosum]